MGVLETMPGDVCDYSFVRKRVQEVAKQFQLQEVNYDPYYAEQLAQELREQDAIKTIEFKQTLPNFAGPTAEFERLVVAHRMEHPNHPILNWQAGNVSVWTDVNGNMRPVKPPQGDHRKIDGIVGAIMALAAKMVNPVPIMPFETEKQMWY
jgi:phage terminase large subunit-like protein